MPESKPNNPYARPVNATRTEGQMLVGEFYGERAHDKQLAGLHGRETAPASRYVGRAVATPADLDAPPEKPKRVRGPKPDKVIVDEVVTSSVEQAITEDDLFG